MATLKSNELANAKFPRYFPLLNRTFKLLKVNKNNRLSFWRNDDGLGSSEKKSPTVKVNYCTSVRSLTLAMMIKSNFNTISLGIH